MENIYKYLSQNLDDEIKKDSIYFFDGKQVKAIAFKQGCKCDCVGKIKSVVKKWGFKYDYDFDAYILKSGDKNETYRTEKNSFISSLIEWKVKKTKTSKNGESAKLYFKGLH